MRSGVVQEFAFESVQVILVGQSTGGYLGRRAFRPCARESQTLAHTRAPGGHAEAAGPAAVFLIQ